MRCDFCYNPDIVYAKNSNYCMNDVLEFLKQRIGLLDGVVLSGGEATTHELKEFCIKIKELGFSIKLDTNGTNYEDIKELVKLNLLDYIALDYKAPQYKFKQITHSNRYNEFSKTLNFLVQGSLDYEVRTTVHRDLLDIKDINFIIDDLIKRPYNKIYYLQDFLETKNIGNLKQSVRKLDLNHISTKLKIEWR